MSTVLMVDDRKVVRSMVARHLRPDEIVSKLRQIAERSAARDGATRDAARQSLQ